MKTIVLASRKGGTGKTTIAYNLGAIYVLAGYKVCFVDLDTQANLTELCNTKPIGLDEWKAGQIVNLSESLAILPASKGFPILETNEKRYPAMIREEVLPLIKGFDYFILDTAPSLSFLNIAALSVADVVLIPVLPDVFSLAGIREMKEIIETIKPGLPYHIVLNAANKGRRLMAAALNALQKEPAFSGLVIPNRQHFSDTNAFHKPAIDLPEIYAIFKGIAEQL